MTEAALADLERLDLVARIWFRDHTAWKPGPTEIADRLGWLDVAHAMRANVPDLQAFAEEARNEGVGHVVLLGMGGSSLGPEVVRQTFGSAPGFPELIVLDSTVPEAVLAVTREIDPARHALLIVVQVRHHHGASGALRPLPRPRGGRRGTRRTRAAGSSPSRTRALRSRLWRESRDSGAHF